MNEAPEIGTVVRTADGMLGWVRTAPTLTASGEVVSLEFLPQDSHLTPTGWTDARISGLTEYRVCACATLGYRDEAGQLVRTDCDPTRTPGKGRKFLPGHDAKAKSFLIKAWGYKMLGGFEHSLDAAREFGFSVQVAAGIDRARAKYLNNPTGESTATRAVMRNLQRDYVTDLGRKTMEQVGYTFPTTSLESFTEEAKRWLRDKTELRGRTIDTADYRVAYDYFRRD